jgi:hypothetical protein
MLTALRVGLLASVAVAAAVTAVPAGAETGCAPIGSGPPPGATTRQIADLDADGRPDTLWIGDVKNATGGLNRLIGVTTAGGATLGPVQVSTASPMPLRALVIDAQDNGQHQLIVSDGREAHLYVLAGCQIQTAVDDAGVPFLFDLENLRGNGTGVGCSDLGDGRHLVGLQALSDGNLWTVRRTEIDLDAAVATIGRSDTVTAASAQDPAVTSAQTISCGDMTINGDGVEEP